MSAKYIETDTNLIVENKTSKDITNMLIELYITDQKHQSL